jgi:hypothetical protein
MIGNRYVPSSFLQHLVPLANIWAGKSMANEADLKAAQLAEAIRGRNATEAQDIVATLRGAPAQAGNLPLQGTTQAIGSIEEPVGEYKAPVAGVAGNQDLALMKALKSTSPIAANIANTLITKSLEGPKEFNLGEGEKRFRVGPNGETIQIASGGGKAHVVGTSLIVDGKEVFKGKEKPIQIDTGTAIQFLDPETRKIIFSTPKHHVFAPQAPIIKETDEGLVAINPYTLKPTPIMGTNNQPIMASKPLTESQGNATAFGMRMIESNKIINNLAKEGVNLPSFFTGLEKVPVIGGSLRAGVNMLPGYAGGQNEKEQSLIQAKKNFITAVLRKESGAAIGPEEYVTEDLKYFPQRGDSQLVIDQKAEARKLAIDAMKIQAGPGSKHIVEKPQINTNEIPNGVTKEQWAVMTPEEKAAFK